MKATRILILSLVMLFAAPAMASTDHHGPKVIKVVKKKRTQRATAKQYRKTRVHPRHHRTRVVRRRVVRRRTRVVRPPHRTVIVQRPAMQRVVVSDSPRANRDIQFSLLQKHLTLSGVEIGFRFARGHLEAHFGTGVNLLDQMENNCRGFNCPSSPDFSWATGLRYMPMSGQFSPYLSVGLQGSYSDIEKTRAMVGGGVHWVTHGGFTASLGVEYAIAEEDPSRAVVPTVTLGYSF